MSAPNADVAAFIRLSTPASEFIEKPIIEPRYLNSFVAVHSATGGTVAGTFSSAFSVVSKPRSAASAAQHDETSKIRGSSTLPVGATAIALKDSSTLSVGVAAHTAAGDTAANTF